MPYKYGPGDPEFLDADPDAGPRPSAYFGGFRRKWAIVDCVVVAGVGVTALVLGWSFHRFAAMLALTGAGTIGLGMLVFMGNQALWNDRTWTHVSSDALGPQLPVDHWARRVSVLLLVAGLSLALAGVALVVASA